MCLSIFPCYDCISGSLLQFFAFLKHHYKDAAEKPLKHATPIPQDTAQVLTYGLWIYVHNLLLDCLHITVGTISDKQK